MTQPTLLPNSTAVLPSIRWGTPMSMAHSHGHPAEPPICNTARIQVLALARIVLLMILTSWVAMVAAGPARPKDATRFLEYANRRDSAAASTQPECECTLLLGMFNTPEDASRYLERGIICPLTLKPYDRVIAFGHDGKMLEVARVVGDNLVRSPLTNYDKVKGLTTRYLVSHSNGNDILINAAKLGLRVSDAVLALAPPRGFDGGARHLNVPHVLIRRHQLDPVANKLGKGSIPLVTGLQALFEWSAQADRTGRGDNARAGVELRARFGPGGSKARLDVTEWRHGEGEPGEQESASGVTRSIQTPFPIKARAYFTNEQFSALVRQVPEAELVLRPHVRPVVDRLSVDDLYIDTDRISDADRKILGRAAIKQIERRTFGPHQYRTNALNYLYGEMIRLADHMVAITRGQLSPEARARASADIGSTAGELRHLAAVAPEAARQAAAQIQTATEAVKRATDRGMLTPPKDVAMPGFGPSSIPEAGQIPSAKRGLEREASYAKPHPPNHSRDPVGTKRRTEKNPVEPIAAFPPEPPPPPPPPSSGSTPLGGIDLIPQTLLAPADPPGIAGIVIDPISQRIVVIGTKGAKGKLDIDPRDLALGLWLAYTGQVAAFSLDADDPKNPAGKWLKAVYYPDALRGTSAGKDLFAADFLLKQLAFCVRIDGKRVVERTMPTGLKCIPDMMKIGGGQGEPQWARLWIVSELVELASTDGVVRVASVRMAVKARRQVPDASSRTGMRDVDTNDDSIEARFARDLTARYEEIARRESPELGRVRELVKAVALAQWLKERNVPVDMGQVVAMLNRDHTPAVDKITALDVHRESVAKETVTVGGRERVRTTTNHIRIFGGVDLAVRPRITEDRNGAALRDIVVSKLAFASTSAEFRVEHGGRVYQAFVLPFSSRGHGTGDTKSEPLRQGVRSVN